MLLKSKFFLIIVINLNQTFCKNIRKRQIYREQVQPHSGGKIPDSAFETDRLILNRLQKEGISVPDGILLDQRNPKVFPYTHSNLRPVFKVSNNRFADVVDNSYDVFPSSVRETTYPIPSISEDRLSNFPIHTTIYQPIHRPLILSNPPLFKSFHQIVQTPLSVMSYGTTNHKHPNSYSTFKYYSTSQIIIPYGIPL